MDRYHQELFLFLKFSTFSHDDMNDAYSEFSIFYL